MPLWLLYWVVMNLFMNLSDMNLCHESIRQARNTRLCIAGRSKTKLPLVDQLRRPAADTHKEPWPLPASPQLHLCWSPDRHACLLFPILSRLYCPVQSLSCVWLFVTPWTAACQASRSITNSKSLLKFMSIVLVMPSIHLILCRPLLLLPSIFPSIRVFSNKLVLHIRWPKDWSFNFSIGASKEYSFAALLLTFQDRHPLFQKAPRILSPPLAPNFGHMTEVRTLSPECLFQSQQWSQLSLGLPWTVSFLRVEAIPTELSKGLGT